MKTLIALILAFVLATGNATAQSQVPVKMYELDPPVCGLATEIVDPLKPLGFGLMGKKRIDMNTMRFYLQSPPNPTTNNHKLIIDRYLNATQTYEDDTYCIISTNQKPKEEKGT